MFRFPHRRCALILSSILLVLPGFSLWAAEPSGHAFVPVQLGFRPNAATVPAHAPDRVLVKLTTGALQTSKIPADLRFGQIARQPETGLPAVDRVLAEGGAKA